VSDEVTRHAEAEAEWVAAQSRWTRSWWQAAMLGVPLVYLIFVVISVRQKLLRHGSDRRLRAAGRVRRVLARHTLRAAARYE